MKTVITASADFACERTIDILARTLWGEARGEGADGMRAVAAVIMNRVKRGGWWGRTVEEVCRKPYQFSCWNRDDPNFAKMRSVNASDLTFAAARRIARRAVYGVLKDPVAGADHYHAAGASPVWACREKPVAVVGRHVFYRLGA